MSQEASDPAGNSTAAEPDKSGPAEATDAFKAPSGAKEHSPPSVAMPRAMLRPAVLLSPESLARSIGSKKKKTAEGDAAANASPRAETPPVVREAEPAADPSPVDELPPLSDYGLEPPAAASIPEPPSDEAYQFEAPPEPEDEPEPLTPAYEPEPPVDPSYMGGASIAPDHVAPDHGVEPAAPAYEPEPSVQEGYGFDEPAEPNYGEELPTPPYEPEPSPREGYRFEPPPEPVYGLEPSPAEFSPEPSQPPDHGSDDDLRSLPGPGGPGRPPEHAPAREREPLAEQEGVHRAQPAGGYERTAYQEDWDDRPGTGAPSPGYERSRDEFEAREAGDSVSGEALASSGETTAGAPQRRLKNYLPGWARSTGIPKRLGAGLGGLLLVGAMLYGFGGAVEAGIQGTIESLIESARPSAAFQFVENFRGGVEGLWDGKGWHIDPSTGGRPRGLVLNEETLDLVDYHLDFEFNLEKGSIGWVVRAADRSNYHGFKLTKVAVPRTRRSEQRSSFVLSRYSVLRGVEDATAVLETDVSREINEARVNKISVRVRGDQIATFVNGRSVNIWKNVDHRAGGIGFWAEEISEDLPRPGEKPEQIGTIEQVIVYGNEDFWGLALYSFSVVLRRINTMLFSTILFPPHPAALYML